MKVSNELPPIPEKRYFTIGEVSHLCAVKPHVLRYWEQEFSMLRPSKRKGSRRYYQQKDILLVRKIRELLYNKGFTISGARQQLKALKLTSESAKKSSESSNVTAKEAMAAQVVEPKVTVALDQPVQSQQSNHSSAADLKSLLPAMRKDLETLLCQLKD